VGAMDEEVMARDSGTGVAQAHCIGRAAFNRMSRARVPCVERAPPCSGRERGRHLRRPRPDQLPPANSASRSAASASISAFTSSPIPPSMNSGSEWSVNPMR